MTAGGLAHCLRTPGNHWSSRYIVSGGSPIAGFRFNVAAKRQGRLQVSRLYELGPIDPRVHSTPTTPEPPMAAD